MGYCWYCHWGWSKPVADIYDRYVAIAGESAMHYGPAHIVWEDENFGRHNVQWCLDHFDEDKGDHTPSALAAVRASLQELLQLDDGIRDPCPATYGEDSRPEECPPPPGLEMMRR